MAARQRCVIGLLILGLVLAIYWPASTFRFVSYDDNLYLSANAPVRRGLTLEGLRWAFTSFHASNWHPLTWLSHMADVELFGLEAGRHHMESVLWHAANALLLFGLLASLTGAPWRSGLVAALFAAHPLHVESVAWVAERKDLLSAFFGLLALWSWAAHLRRPRPALRAGAAGLFALSLLAKPMLVTLPFILLLLDWWPLGRILPPRGTSAGTPMRRAVPLLIEKLPLFALAAASSFMTYLAQRRGGALTTLSIHPFARRAVNAVLSYCGYLELTLRPRGLTFYYPLGGGSAAEVAGAAALLGGVCALVFLQARRRPFLVTGWLWYLGALVPVLGLVKVGLSAMNDRYTYLPLVGVFIALAWLLPAAAAARRAVPIAAVAAVLALALLARRQALTWRDSETLFRHALAVTGPANFMAGGNLAWELLRQGREEEALPLLREAIRTGPPDERAYLSIGQDFARRGNLEIALAAFTRAAAIHPDSALAHNGLGATLARLGRLDEAYPHFLAAVRARPGYAEAYSNLGRWHEIKGDLEAASAAYCRALELDPQLGEARARLGTLLLRLGRPREALEHLQQAVRAGPHGPEVERALGQALVQAGRADEGRARLEEAARPAEPGGKPR